MGNALKRRLKQTKFEGPHHEAMLNLLVASAHVRAAMDRVCANHAITEAQYNVLRILRGALPDGYPRCEIAVRMLERAPDVTRLIDRLAKEGLVARTRSGDDLRLSITRITPDGLDLLNRMEDEVAGVHQQFAERWSVRDAREVSKLLEHLYEPETP